ncbi:HD-GYP domain-containing protein [Paludibacterium yongneupense]|uniref:HD-GYP domain-containing protein n=1 Tax=Paludibacterium yongneupense TaxID=400061 RepID=UPI0004190E08|nr:HD domain-containing phosphohydrolase [Paludibacterium yongneupense]
MSRHDLLITKLPRVQQSAVSVGRALTQDVFSSKGLLLLKQGHYVLGPEQKDRLLRMGVAAPELPPPSENIDSQPVQERHSVFSEVAHLCVRLRGLLRNPVQVRDFPAAIGDVAHSIMHLAATQADGMLAGILLVPIGEYGSAHSVHTACLLALLTQRMPLSPEIRLTLLCAALTMNIALTDLQNELYSQSEALREDQRESIASHPLVGSAILREVGIDNELWHVLVQTHHESWTGHGYPFTLNRRSINPLAHILHLADVTCAKLTPRRYRVAMLPATALGHIFQRKDAEFDAAFITLLVKELGIYPPGSFVRLASDEIGVVTHPRAKPSQPSVAALRRMDAAPYAEPLLRETRNPAFKVVEPCAASLAGVRTSYLAHLWRA